MASPIIKAMADHLMKSLSLLLMSYCNPIIAHIGMSMGSVKNPKRGMQLKPDTQACHQISLVERRGGNDLYK